MRRPTDADRERLARELGQAFAGSAHVATAICSFVARLFDDDDRVGRDGADDAHLPLIRQREIGEILGWIGSENAFDAAKRVVRDRDTWAQRARVAEEKLVDVVEALRKL